VWQADDTNAYILTNAHVIRGSQFVSVAFNDGRQVTGHVMGADEFSDVGLIRVPDTRATGLPMANPESLKPGQPVFAIGAPLGLSWSVTAGIISAVNRTEMDQNHPLMPFIQTDAAVNPGNSGGPLFDAEGRVVGINTQILSTSGTAFIGIALAIPIGYATSVGQVLKERGQLERGWMGVTAQTVTPDLAPSFPGARVGNAVVAGVDPKGPAASMLAPGDVVAGIDGKPFHGGAPELAWRGALAGPGHTIHLKVLKRHGADTGEPVTVAITLSDVPKANKDTVKAPAASEGTPLAGERLTPQQAEALHLKSTDPLPMMLTQLPAWARRAGLATGDVVLDVDGVEQPSDAEMRRALFGNGAAAFLILRNGRQGFIAVPRQNP